MEIKINFKAVNMELTEAVKNYAEEKVYKLDKFIDQGEDVEPIAEIELGKSKANQQAGDIFFVEVNLEVSGEMYRAVAEKDDLYAAIDQMKDELAQQLKKTKDKKREQELKGEQKLKEILHNPDLGEGLE